MKMDVFGIGGAVVLLAMGLIVVGVLTYLNRPLYMATPGLIWGVVVVVWAVVLSAIKFWTARKRSGG